MGSTSEHEPELLVVPGFFHLDSRLDFGPPNQPLFVGGISQKVSEMQHVEGGRLPRRLPWTSYLLPIAVMHPYPQVSCCHVVLFLWYVVHACK